MSKETDEIKVLDIPSMLKVHNLWLAAIGLPPEIEWRHAPVTIKALVDEYVQKAIKQDALPQILTGGVVRGPKCCGELMDDNGGCYDGCCDDYKCKKCGKTQRVEWPD